MMFEQISAVFNRWSRWLLAGAVLLVVLIFAMCAGCASRPDWKSVPEDGPDTERRPDFGP